LRDDILNKLRFEVKWPPLVRAFHGYTSGSMLVISTACSCKAAKIIHAVQSGVRTLALRCSRNRKSITDGALRRIAGSSQSSSPPLQVVVVYNEDDAADQDNAYPEIEELIRRSDPASEDELSEDEEEGASGSEDDDGYASSDGEGPSQRPGKSCGSIGDIYIEVTNQPERMERKEKGKQQALTESSLPQVLLCMCCPYVNDCVASIA
jgi:hypothetical protein